MARFVWRRAWYGAAEADLALLIRRGLFRPSAAGYLRWMDTVGLAHIAEDTGKIRLTWAGLRTDRRHARHMLANGSKTYYWK